MMIEPAPWVAVKFYDRWIIIRVRENGSRETLTDCRGRQRLFRTSEDAWLGADDLNARELRKIYYG